MDQIDIKQQLWYRLGEQQEANMMHSIVDTLRGHRKDSNGAPGNVLLPVDSSGIPLPFAPARSHPKQLNDMCNKFTSICIVCTVPGTVAPCL